jgi:hypothetical protein
MNKATKFISIAEAEFEYRQLDDLLNTIRQFEPGEYDLSGVEAVFTTSVKKANISEIQGFITKYHRVCYIMLNGYSESAKSLILLSDEPKKIGPENTAQNTGAIICKNRLFAYNLK